MTWPPDIAGELPAPRDDEPSSLRQDIADELADHLHSSFTRELHRTPEEASAKHNVLDRFGDPRRVARQLWFDAMKEKIVSQRLNLVVSSLMAAACLGALGLMVLTFRESREVNAAMLEKLQALTAPHPATQPAPAADEGAKSMDWVRLKFKLVLGEKGGPPAVGFNIQIRNAGGMGGMGGMVGSTVLGETEKNGQILTGVVEETTNADGIADLGLFRFGSYMIYVAAPWGETTSRQIGVRPGQEPIRDIVCPVAAPDAADVAFDVDWPDDLKPQRLRLICNFGTAIRRVGSEWWSFKHAPRDFLHSKNNAKTSESLIVDTDGKTAMREMISIGGQNAFGMPDYGNYSEVRFLNPTQFDDTFQFPALRIRITNVLVVKPDAGPEPGRFPVLAQYTTGVMGFDGMGGMGGGGGGFFHGPNQADGFSFDAQPGNVNHWRIKLPAGVLDQVRVKLKMIPEPAEAAEREETGE
jgi:hypothetical protein